VADRLRTDRAGVLLSGGLDSSSVAATARELSAKSPAPVDLRAFTVTYESLFADRDGEHARKAAEFLGMPVRCLPMDGLQLFERWDDPQLNWPEPVDDPFFAGLFDQFRAISADCRVVFSGEGIDNLMHFEMWPYVQDLHRNREWRRLFAEVPRYLWLRPFPWKGIRHRVGKLFAGDRAPAVPRWIAPDFARRVGIEARWREHSTLRPVPGHPNKPEAHASLSLPHWSRLFELTDSGWTHCPVEVRYPFLDLRIVNYVLALPPFPWAFEKRLLREAMAGRLPESVRLRPKTPLARDPLVETFQQASASFEGTRWCEEIGHYVDVSGLSEPRLENDPERATAAIRPQCFNFWLQSARRIRYNLMSEVRNG
jgi:asparagine synthase (glutamine-hydrolysing)